MTLRVFAGAASIALCLAACGGGESVTFGTGGAGTSSASTTVSVSATGTGGAGGSGSTGVGGEAPHYLYPDIATLHELGISRTCSRRPRRGSGRPNR